MVAITYEQLPKSVEPGQRILIQDGTVLAHLIARGLRNMADGAHRI